MKRAKERCRQCEDALLDLSEHEPLTAQTAAPILARCPECLDRLRRLVEGFALAYELPSEEPTTRADAFVWRLADERHSRIVTAADHARSRTSRLRVRRNPWGPLAMAAAALMTIAIGASLLGAPSESDQVPVAQPSNRSPTIEPREQELPSQPFAGSGSARETGASTSPRHRPRKPDSAVDAPTRVEPNERPLPRLQGHPHPNMPALGGGSSPDGSNPCKTRVTVFEDLLARRQGFTSSPAELLEVGLCYQRLGNRDAARKWLTQASRHRETRVRAINALQDLE